MYMFDILISKSLELLVAWQYKGLFIASLGLFPMEIVIAILATTHKANIWLISLVSATGGLVGSYLTYLLGYLFKEDNLYRWLEGNGKFLRVDRKALEMSKRKILKRSFLYVLITRLIPWLRVVASLAAGFLKVNIFTYSIAVFVGGFIYAFLIAYLGSKVDSDLESIKTFISLVDKWLVLITVGYIFIAIGYKQRKKIGKYIYTIIKKFRK